MSEALRRVVITGLGAIAPNGIGTEQFWQACLAGRSGLRKITRFDASMLPAQVAGEVSHFEPGAFGITPDEAYHIDRAGQFALAAARLALEDAGLATTLSTEQRERTGVYIGTAMPCLEEGEKQWTRLTDNGAHEVISKPSTPLPATLLMSHTSASSIAARNDLHGPCLVIATGCSAGADAIGQAYWSIQEGRAERMLAGGADASISYGVLDAFCVMGALSIHFNAQPERASRPYDGLRDGFVMAEGAGVVVLEDRELALARGAHSYAEIIAFASNTNAHHMTSLPPDGRPLQYLLQQICTEARIAPTDLGYINAHGSSTPTNEVAETTAYKAVFGKQAYSIPISATKSLIGHAQGAASALEAIVTALVIDRQHIPPTINQEQRDPRCDLDYVPNIARPATVNVALTHSSGFGGVNSALLFARSDWTTTYER